MHEVDARNGLGSARAAESAVFHASLKQQMQLCSGFGAAFKGVDIHAAATALVGQRRHIYPQSGRPGFKGGRLWMTHLKNHPDRNLPIA